MKQNGEKQSLLKYMRKYSKTVLEQHKTQCVRNVWQVESRKTKSEQQHIELTDLDVHKYKYICKCVHLRTYKMIFVHEYVPRNQL